jgi:hypothetical protein
MQQHHWIGLLTVLTLMLMGAAVGHIVGLSDGEGIYFTLLVLALIGWWSGRSRRRRKGHA